jgi:hypothetical protein
MKTTEKINRYYAMIEGIDYNNREGGKYAYVQLLSYTREVLVLLQPLSKIQRQRVAIESISRVFNDYLSTSFGDQQRIIFDMKRRELKGIFDTLNKELCELDAQESDSSVFLKESL